MRPLVVQFKIEPLLNGHVSYVRFMWRQPSRVREPRHFSVLLVVNSMLVTYTVGFHMVQDLSAGPWAGEEGPMLGLVFGRTTGFGLRAGGFSCTPILGATRGLKVLMVSLEELVLRRICGSELRSTRLWSGLKDSVEVVLEGEFFMGSKVSSTTSGACFAELWRSSSRSSFRAVFMVSSISCSEGEASALKMNADDHREGSGHPGTELQ